MNSAQKMMDFIQKSPSCFHAINNIKETLIQKGFKELKESQVWKLDAGGKYFVTRNGSSIISFTLPSATFQSFLICASHSDSPTFKIKENPELSGAELVSLNVEKYGRMLINPWFDRPLSIAGRIVVSEKSDSTKLSFKSILINFDRDLVMIPNLAIHMNRDANEGHHFDLQQEIRPVISENEDFSLKKLLAKEAGVKAEEIISYDLFLYNRDKGTFWGEKKEFISSPKLDDLECVYTSLQAFLNAAENPVSDKNVKVYVVFDNEEVGSNSRQGAGSTFLYDTLRRINESFGRSEQEYFAAIAQSFLVSADNAHAIHPNYISSADPVNRPCVNGGPVIKFNAAQKYTSDGISASVFKKICDEAKVPYQIYTNNSNIAGGSTLGNISNSQVSLMAVDIGIAQWSMHSPNESAGSKDVEYMEKALTRFYNSEIEVSC